MFKWLKNIMSGNTYKIALCIGHSRKAGKTRDGGAVSIGNVQEWDYNRDLAVSIQNMLTQDGHTVKIFDTYEGIGYEAAMLWLAGSVKSFGADVAIELHFNSADSQAACGHEWLYLKLSDKSMMLAAHIDKQFIQNLPELRHRGLAAMSSGDRGYTFCKTIHCPCVISEPFFGSNKHDWEIAVTKKSTIAKSIAYGLISWLHDTKAT